MTVPKRIVPVLAGGGTRLPAHVGVLTALNDMGIGFDHIVGVSGGSVVAALAAVGKNQEDMTALFRTVNFLQFRGYSLVNLLRHGGLSTGKRFEQWMDGELGGRRFCDLEKSLHVVATDVRSGRPVLFNRENSPDLSVARAVLYSISIPLLFPFHHHGDHILVDGSILAEDSLFQDWAGDLTPVVCFRLRDKRIATAHPARKYLPVADYMFMLVRTFMSTISREYLSEALWLNTVLIETEGMSPLEFNMSTAQKQTLFDLGYATTQTYLPAKLARVMGPVKQAVGQPSFME
ncbi:MAG: patatin-like phospholipase family protein [Pseudomonadota bacterium]|nr:patatin-like phospholipase family protein [Pseudomonadota bacterium]MDP1905546.1 patatin-like phospholipase family protein [Pseudomonadota bacterium]MDP2352285.1 patatin-like phospholipase family protein [Pseudomonadota bacterium]